MAFSGVNRTGMEHSTFDHVDSPRFNRAAALSSLGFPTHDSAMKNLALEI
jgi:hypothetical protein